MTAGAEDSSANALADSHVLTPRLSSALANDQMPDEWLDVSLRSCPGLT